MIELLPVSRTPRPPLREMRWADIESLFRSLGHVEEREGSQVAINIHGVPADFHRPHPSPMVGRRTVKDVMEFLAQAGVQPSHGR